MLAAQNCELAAMAAGITGVWVIMTRAWQLHKTLLAGPAAVLLSCGLTAGYRRLSAGLRSCPSQHTDLHPVCDAGGLHAGSCVDSIAKEGEARVSAPHD